MWFIWNTYFWPKYLSRERILVDARRELSHKLSEKLFWFKFPPNLPIPTWILRPVHVTILFSSLKVILFSRSSVDFNVERIQKKAAFLVTVHFPLLHPSLREYHSCRGTVVYFSDPCVFQPIPEPKGGRLIQVEGYWISVGDKEPTIDETYILTSSVKLNLRDIVRVVSAGCVDLSSHCSDVLPA